MTPEQISFVQGQLAGGATKEQVTQLLLDNGYTADQVAELLAAATSERVDTVVGVTGALDEAAAPGLLPFGVTLSNTMARVTARGPLFAGFIVFSAITTFVYSFESTDAAIRGVSSVVSLLLAVVSLAVGMVLLRNMLRDAPAGLADDISWVSRNFLSCLWVSILIGLLVISGSLLLIIPGVVLGIYLMLAQAVRISEGVRGMQALVRSTELIRGYWWGVFWRVIGLAVALGLVGGIVQSLIGTIVGAKSSAAELVGAVVQAVLGFVLVALSAELYAQLSAGKPPFDTAGSQRLRTGYTVFGWLSIAVIVLCVGAVIMLL